MKGEIEYLSQERVFHGSIPHVMGTRLELLAVGVAQESILEIWDCLYDMVFDLDRRLNRFDPSSEVSYLNIYDNPLEQDKSAVLEEVTRLAQEYCVRTGGLFDVTDRDGKLDFGGFGKGYFLKLCEKVLRERGVDCAFVDFGSSSILGIGHHPYGDSWKVGLVNPYTRQTVKEISLNDSSMSTSGNIPSYSGHIRNPRTDETCSARKVVNVVAQDPLDAEVLSTVLMVASDQDREELKAAFPDAVWEEFDLEECI